MMMFYMLYATPKYDINIWKCLSDIAAENKTTEFMSKDPLRFR